MATNTKPGRYREITAVGPPRQLGRQIGEQAREEVRGFCQFAWERVLQTTSVSTDKALGIARESLTFAQEYSPDMVEELTGVAEAAGVSLDDLMLLQVRNQLPLKGVSQPDSKPSVSRPPTSQPPASRPTPLSNIDSGGCTSVSVPKAKRIRRAAVAAQNWDNDPALDAFTIVLTRKPQGKPAVLNCTQAGLIAYIGFNSKGIGACLNTLPAPSREVGAPHYFTLRGIYEASSLDGAVEAVRRAKRAIPANIMLTTPQGPADLEVTLDDVHVLRDDTELGVTHTNHCLHPDLSPINDQFPELIQSHTRKERIDQLLESAWAAGEPDLHAVQRLLRDHDNYPRSICRHANDDPVTGNWETVFSIILEPSDRRMHVTRGTPCERLYATYELR